MSTIADVVTRVQTVDVPVLFVDTCSLVDVIRAPLRFYELRGCIEAAQELLQLVAAQPIHCILVVASFVPDEWLAHAGTETDKLRKLLIETDEQAGRLHDFCGLAGITPPFPQTGYRLLPLADRLHDLSRQLLDSALRLDPDQDCIIRAHGRASAYLPPSRKGGEVKDSTIIEECLEVCRCLQGVGFPRKQVFCSSNVKDYCETGTRLRQNLAIDFGAVNLGFAASLHWAVHEIKT